MREKGRKAIVAAFKAGWVGGDAFPVELPNQPFDVPDAGAYGRLSIRWGARFPASLGQCRTRQIGVVILQIFTPEETGMKAANVGADLMATIFDLTQIEIEPGLALSFGTASGGGDSNEDGIEQTNVDVDFQIDLTT